MSFEDYKLETIGKRGFSEIFKGTKEGSQDCFIVKRLKKDYLFHNTIFIDFYWYVYISLINY